MKNNHVTWRRMYSLIQKLCHYTHTIANQESEKTLVVIVQDGARPHDHRARRQITAAAWRVCENCSTRKQQAALVLRVGNSESFELG